VIRGKLRQAGDLLAGLVYLTLLYLPPSRPLPDTQLVIAAHRADMYARLDSLNAALHAGSAKGHAELARHYAERARHYMRVSIVLATISVVVSLTSAVTLWAQ
jgi:hypothetical protein